MAFNKDKYTPEELKEYYKNYYYKTRKAKLDKQRAENPVIRTCAVCGKEFKAKGIQKYCSTECRQIATKARYEAQKGTPEYIEKRKQIAKRYATSEKGKATIKKYRNSEKGRAVIKKYLEKRKEQQKKANIL